MVGFHTQGFALGCIHFAPLGLTRFEFIVSRTQSVPTQGVATKGGATQGIITGGVVLGCIYFAPHPENG